MLGLLLYISKCVKPARYFLNHILELLRDNLNNPHIFSTEEFLKALAWFQIFLKSYNGVSISDIRPLNIKNFVYSIPLPRSFNDYNIVHFEMLNVVMALKLWAVSWANKCIHIYCDNQAVVDV